MLVINDDFLNEVRDDFLLFDRFEAVVSGVDAHGFLYRRRIDDDAREDGAFLDADLGRMLARPPHLTGRVDAPRAFDLLRVFLDREELVADADRRIEVFLAGFFIDEADEAAAARRVGRYLPEFAFERLTGGLHAVRADGRFNIVRDVPCGVSERGDILCDEHDSRPDDFSAFFLFGENLIGHLLLCAVEDRERGNAAGECDFELGGLGAGPVQRVEKNDWADAFFARECGGRRARREELHRVAPDGRCDVGSLAP